MHDRRYPVVRGGLVTIILLAVAAPSQTADTQDSARPKDAAEAVQEGNVDNWLKYYQRERGQTATPPSPPVPTPQPPDPQPARRR